MTNNTLLLDADMVVFSICISHEHEVQWDDEVHTLHTRFSDCLDALKLYLADIKEKLDAEHCVFAFSGASNFRKDVLPTYKANRKKVRKPLAYQRLRQYIEDTEESLCFDTLEADDVLGIYATNNTYKNPIIVSDDKDLLSIPGRVYRLDELHTVSEQEADFNHLKQALTGDVTDGYKGCPGIGPKKAEAILKTLDWNNIVTAYEAAGLTEDDALAQARVARILRHTEWDADKERVILWKPSMTEQTSG